MRAPTHRRDRVRGSGVPARYFIHAKKVRAAQREAAQMAAEVARALGYDPLPPAQDHPTCRICQAERR